MSAQSFCLVAVALLASCRYSSPEGQRSRAAARAPRLATSWDIPEVNPCAILSRTAVETLTGTSVADPWPGETAMDGSACQYAGSGPFVITLGFMSTNAYDHYYVARGDQIVDVWPIMGRSGSAQR